MADGNANRSKRRTVILTLGVLALMTALTVAAVPLYRAFCQATGYGGTTQVADSVPEVGDRWVTVRFNADTGRGMPWHFRPEQNEVRVRVGEQVLAFFEAENPTKATITGAATFNVTPEKAGRYFSKIDCFCFTEQVLGPGQRADMPVTFFVDPEIYNDPNTWDVNTITLSYTFFEQDSDAEQDSAALVTDDASGLVKN
jgi:cytochrome c oxidase assembly protein subunit 11